MWAVCPVAPSVWVTFPAADRGQVPAANPYPTPRAPPTAHIAPLFQEGHLGVGGTARGCLHPRDPKSPLPSPCPRLCQLLLATLPRACGFSIRISLSFLPRTEQLIIYPIIKEETVNEMKTSQKHLLGLLSSPPRAACAGSGGGRGTGAPGGPRQQEAVPAHSLPCQGPLLLLGTPRPGTLSPPHHQKLAESCQARVSNSTGDPATGVSP